MDKDVFLQTSELIKQARQTHDIIHIPSIPAHCEIRQCHSSDERSSRLNVIKTFLT
jgi:hypothetical protein